MLTDLPRHRTIMGERLQRVIEDKFDEYLANPSPETKIAFVAAFYRFCTVHEGGEIPRLVEVK